MSCEYITLDTEYLKKCIENAVPIIVKVLKNANVIYLKSDYYSFIPVPIHIFNLSCIHLIVNFLINTVIFTNCNVSYIDPNIKESESINSTISYDSTATMSLKLGYPVKETTSILDISKIIENPSAVNTLTDKQKQVLLDYASKVI